MPLLTLTLIPLVECVGNVGNSKNQSSSKLVPAVIVNFIARRTARRKDGR